MQPTIDYFTGTDEEIFISVMAGGWYVLRKKNRVGKNVYAVATFDHDKNQWLAPNFYGEGCWYGNLSYVANWVCHKTAKKRLIELLGEELR